MKHAVEVGVLTFACAIATAAAAQTPVDVVAVVFEASRAAGETAWRGPAIPGCADLRKGIGVRAASECRPRQRRQTRSRCSRSSTRPGNAGADCRGRIQGPGGGTATDRGRSQARGCAEYYERLKAASATPGVVAENDVQVAQRTAEAAQALVRSYDSSLKAAQAHVKAVRDLGQYLRITAPFDGIITERNVHPGALVGPGTGATPLFQLHQVSRLRLVVAVPEALVGAIVRGARVPFTVPAYPGEPFYGVVRLAAHDLDVKTRSMPVELEVLNADVRLAPGMYAEVSWPVKRAQASLLVPPTSIVTTTERTFVIRLRAGVAEWVNVRSRRASG